MFGNYTTPRVLSDPLSTNAFSYAAREMTLGHRPEIIITPWKIGSWEDIDAGIHLVIQEIDHTGALHSHTGLKHNIYIQGSTPLAIMDNHNHALGMWRELSHKLNKTPIVIHIDTHADLQKALTLLPQDTSEEKIRDYVHTQTHIGSFIHPALESGLIQDCVQIRSSYALEHLQLDPNQIYIIDIDLDFWAGEKHISADHLRILHDLIQMPATILLTIATSPYFLDHHQAMHFLDQLRPHLQNQSDTV